MQKVFSNHSHHNEEEVTQATPSDAHVVESSPEANATQPAIAEKPPVETAAHLQEKQASRRGYFTRAHRIKARVSGRK